MVEKKIPTTFAHLALFKDLCGIVQRYADAARADEILAVAANMVGKLIALQDPSKYTAPQAMDLVLRNIAEGNKEAGALLTPPPGAPN